MTEDTEESVLYQVHAYSHLQKVIIDKVLMLPSLTQYVSGTNPPQPLTPIVGRTYVLLALDDNIEQTKTQFGPIMVYYASSCEDEWYMKQVATLLRLEKRYLSIEKIVTDLKKKLGKVYVYAGAPGS